MSLSPTATNRPQATSTCLRSKGSSTCSKCGQHGETDNCQTPNRPPQRSFTTQSATPTSPWIDTHRPSDLTTNPRHGRMFRSTARGRACRHSLAFIRWADGWRDCRHRPCWASTEHRRFGAVQGLLPRRPVRLRRDPRVGCIGSSDNSTLLARQVDRPWHPTPPRVRLEPQALTHLAAVTGAPFAARGIVDPLTCQGSRASIEGHDTRRFVPSAACPTVRASRLHAGQPRSQRGKVRECGSATTS